MIHTILVPNDGSEHAEKAADLAIDLAAKYDARLVLLRVFEAHEITPAMLREAGAEGSQAGRAQYAPGMVEITSELMADIRKEEVPREALDYAARQSLQRAEAAAQKQGLAKFKVIGAQGNPAKRILECAENIKADMIVMGSRGLGDLRGLMLGSVSHKVSHLATCTCIVVR